MEKALKIISVINSFLKKIFHQNKRAKNKISKSLTKNIAHHPFVLVAIVAAITVVVLVIIFKMLKVII